ncbi:MAG: hypothetical protein HY587_00965 [Candidatus Omnitrophica bacterium]|nr:hypothetical protein [Candidatus Omnitrophota bacterium]
MEACLVPLPTIDQIRFEPAIKKTRPRAVGLLSGGLDSTIAALVVRDLGVEVYGLCFALPWGCCSKDQAFEVARALGIKFMVLQLDESYLEMVKNPKYGRGRALNPCVDCRIHMFSRARRYMEQIGADFVFTGEVLGQRPMSQMKRSLAIIEEQTGLKGRLLRPLSAKLLEPTVPELEGLIDRGKLLSISGRGRKEQMALAAENGVHDYPAPAGGCQLTEEHFSRKMADLLEHGYQNFREAVTLKWGRHFRISSECKAILGRNEEENEILRRFSFDSDTIMELPGRRGPTVLLKCGQPSRETLALAAGLLKYYSRHRGGGPVEVEYHRSGRPHEVDKITAANLNEVEVQSLLI